MNWNPIYTAYPVNQEMIWLNDLTRCLKVFSDHFRDYPTGIVVCEKPGIATDVIMQHLIKNKVVAAERLGRVRFSPHIYISPEQIDEVLRVLTRME